MKLQFLKTRKFWYRFIVFEDSIIREVTKSKISETEKLKLDEKIEWLIDNNRNK